MSRPQGQRSESIEKKKIKAQYLIMQIGLSQKDTAQKVGVSVRAISEWANKYGWRASQNNAYRNLEGSNLGLFVDYLRNNDPNCYDQVTEHLKAFLLISYIPPVLNISDQQGVVPSTSSKS